MKTNAGTVTAYIEALPPDRQRTFETLRGMFEKAAPKAKGSMRLGFPTWELAGPLFALVAREAVTELYVAEPDLVAKRKRTLGDVEVGTTSVRFKRIEDLNLAVLGGLLADAADRRKGGPRAPAA
jgi:uncharacterized protein YdhG (YjbR/CyaY superfamily)